VRGEQREGEEMNRVKERGNLVPGGREETPDILVIFQGGCLLHVGVFRGFWGGEESGKVKAN